MKPPDPAASRERARRVWPPLDAIGAGPTKSGMAGGDLDAAPWLHGRIAPHASGARHVIVCNADHASLPINRAHA